MELFILVSGLENIEMVKVSKNGLTDQNMKVNGKMTKPTVEESYYMLMGIFTRGNG